MITLNHKLIENINNRINVLRERAQDKSLTLGEYNEMENEFYHLCEIIEHNKQMANNNKEHKRLNKNKHKNKNNNKFYSAHVLNNSTAEQMINNPDLFWDKNIAKPFQSQKFDGFSDLENLSTPHTTIFQQTKYIKK